MLAMIKVNNKNKRTMACCIYFFNLNTCILIYFFFLITLNIYLSVGQRIKSTKQLKCTLKNKAVTLKHVPVT